MKFFDNKFNKIIFGGLCVVAIFFSVGGVCLADFGVDPGGDVTDDFISPVLNEGEVCSERTCACNGIYILKDETCIMVPVLKDGEICPEGKTIKQCLCENRIILRGEQCIFKTTADVELDLQIPITDLEGNVVSKVNNIGEYFNLVYNWSIGALSIIAVVMIMIAGFQWITAGGNEKGIGDAKKRIYNAIFGLVLIGVSYLILQIVNPATLSSNILIPKIVKMLGGGSSGGTGNCTQMMGDAISASTDWGQETTRDQWDDLLRSAAEANNIDCDYLKAIMLQESGGKEDAESKAGACGLMQVLPGTAETLGFPNDCTWLKTAANGIAAGAKFAAESLSKVDGDFNLMAARYNGGDQALEASADCPGLYKWQCEWDNPEHTIKNEGPGSFEETREYVQKTQGFLNMIISNKASCNETGSRATICTKGGNGVTSPVDSYSSVSLNPGWKFQSGIKDQVPDASPELIKLLNCMRDKLDPKYGEISSISDSKLSSSCTRNCCTRTPGNDSTASGSCSHSLNSCHYGGGKSSAREGDDGFSFAVDFGDQQNSKAIIFAAEACNAKRSANEGDHVHVSVKQCDKDIDN